MSVHDLTTVDWFCLLLACSGVALWALSFILTRKIERIADDMRRGSAIVLPECGFACEAAEKMIGGA